VTVCPTTEGVPEDATAVVVVIVLVTVTGPLLVPGAVQPPRTAVTTYV
jgi:hypothetical protein